MVYKMEKYQTYTNFTNGTIGVTPVIQSVVTAVPVFFPVTLFFFWLLIAGSSYFTILKTTGKKRFWQSLTASSFVTFILSLVVASMNTTAVTVLQGYWIGFYILMTLVSWYMLSNYK